MSTTKSSNGSKSQQPSSEQSDSGRVSEVVGETAESLAVSARDCARECTEYYVTEPAKDLISLMKDYAKKNPDVAAAWAFGAGLILGWKLKP